MKERTFQERKKRKQIVLSDTQQLLFLGVPNSGKSYAMKRLLNETIRKSRISTSWLGLDLLECPRVLLYDPKGEYKQLDRWPVRERHQHDPASYPFIRYGEVDLLLEEAKKYGGILVIEELLTILDGENFVRRLQSISAMRRAYGLAIVAATQRPVFIPKAMLALSNWIYCFRLVDPDDKKAVKHIASHQIYNQIDKLEQGEFYSLKVS